MLNVVRRLCDGRENDEAMRGAKVVLACRSLSRCLEAKLAIGTFLGGYYIFDGAIRHKHIPHTQITLSSRRGCR